MHLINKINITVMFLKIRTKIITIYNTSINLFKQFIPIARKACNYNHSTLRYKYHKLIF